MEIENVGSGSHSHNLLDPIPPSKELLSKWLKRHLHLLQQERGEEQEQSKMLLNNTPIRQLELNGLAILSLGVASVKVGLGAKLLVELTRPSAYHSVPQFPPHSLRPGDLAQIEDHSTTPSNSNQSQSQHQSGKSSKSKSKASSSTSTSRGTSDPIQGVVFKVTPTSIIIAASSSNDRNKSSQKSDGKKDSNRSGNGNKSSGQEEKELNLPERCRVIKVANEVTYDRMDQTLLRLARILSLELEEEEKKVKSTDPIQTSKHQSEPEPLKDDSKTNEEEEEKVAEDEEVEVEETEIHKEEENKSNRDGKEGSENDKIEESEQKAEEADEPSTKSKDESISPLDSRDQSDPTAIHDPSSETTSKPLQKSLLSSKGPSPLIETLLGLRTPTYNSDPSLPLAPFNSGLNSIQLSSISRMLSADHFSLLHGPPGTGKTTVLAELILQLTVGLKKRVLVCGASNLAVDNLMEKMLEGGSGKGKEALKKEGMGVTRVGHPARVLPSLLSCTLDTQTSASSEGQLMKDVGKELEQALTSLSPRSSNPSGSSKDPKPQPGNKSVRTAPKLSSSARKAKWEEVKLLRAEFRKRERGVTTSVLSRAQVVMATCHGSGGRILEKNRDESGFDVVIIDEACQAMEAVCWIPILRAKWNGKLILAGDHLQLPPTVKSTKKDKKFDRERMKLKKAERKLKKKEKLAKKKAEVNTEGDRVADQIQDLEIEEADRDHSEKEDDEDLDDYQTADEDSESEEEEEIADRGATFVPSESNQTSEEDTESSPLVSRPSLRPPRSLETTLFSRLLALYGSGCKSLLRVQYRMNEEIMSFPNKAMYEDQLLAAESCSKGRLIDLEGFEKQEDSTEDLDEEIWNSPLVFYDTIGNEMFESSGDSSSSNGNDVESRKNIRSLQSDSKSNANEVTIVIQHLETLLKHGLKLIDIGVIAPYSAQVSLLTSSIREHFTKNPISSPSNEVSDLNELEIGTVDGLQGREKEAIILTLVRSNQNKEVGFLAERRRLNVAMTRAKKHLVVVCDSETVGRAKDSGDKERKFLKGWMDELEEKAVLCPVGI